MGPLGRFSRWRAAAAIFGVVNFELLDQMANFRGSLHQLLRGFLGIRCSARSALGRLSHPRNVAGDFSAAVRRFAYVARPLISGGILLLHRGSNGVGDAIDLIDDFTDGADRSHGYLGINLNGFDLATGGLGGLLGRLLHLGSRYRKALASLTGASNFDCRVQRQQVGLLSDKW